MGTFYFKLEPAAKETWTAVITGSGPRRRWPRWWPPSTTNPSMPTNLTIGKRLSPTSFRRDRSNLSSRFENASLNFRHLHGGWKRKYERINWFHRGWRPEMIGALWSFSGGRLGLKRARRSAFLNEGGVPYSYLNASVPMEMAMDSAGPVPAAAPMMAMRKSAESAGDFAEGLSDKASAGPVAPPKSPTCPRLLHART